MAAKKKKERFKPDEIVYLTAVWKVTFEESKKMIPKLTRAEYYFYNEIHSQKKKG